MKLLKRLLRITAWILLAVVLTIVATVVCVVSLLSPDRLTPVCQKYANEYLDADVSIGRVQLEGRAAYPFLQLTVDSLVVVNPTVTKLKTDTALHLPQYADTLLSVNRFSGEIKLTSLATGKIDIGDVIFDGPAVNVVFVSDSLSNLDIFPATTETEESKEFNFPEIDIRRFVISNPKPIRYYNAADSTFAECKIDVLLQKSDAQPSYKLDFSGNLNSPVLRDFKFLEMPFTLNGDVFWNYSNPYVVRLENFGSSLAFINFALDTEVDFAEQLKVNMLDFKLNPLEVASILEHVPDSLIQVYGLQRLKTNAKIAMTIRLDSVFDMQKDSIPYATVGLDLPECSLSYGNARFEKLALSLRAITKGNDLNKAEVIVENLLMKGPATQLQISATVDNLVADPKFDLRVDGRTNLTKLPPPLMKLIPGYISGKINAALSVSGRASMFDCNNFHRLKADGDLDANDLYWVSPDTANMVYVNDACFKFNTQRHYQKANLLSASIDLDSLDILSGGISINVKDISLGVGVENSHPSADTTLVVPMGGGLKFKSLNLSSFSDSTALRIRDVEGRVVMRRFNNEARIPEFIFNLGIKRMAAGAPDVRLMFSGTKIDFSAHKLPQKKANKELKRLADSIRVSRPDLSADSVYQLALERHQRNRRPYHRVHTEQTDSDSELIDWGTSTALKKLLLEWKINGSLTSKKARLFTPHFPLRNRLNNLNISFDNDSLIFNAIAYKVGHSDFLADGRITNLKRGLTSKKGRSPLKVQFHSVSDTIDVNQLSDAFFRGAAYTASGQRDMVDLNSVDSDDDFEREIDHENKEQPDSMGPLLVPLNIEADFSVKAKNILYSDLLLHDMTGNMLVYDGAVNLHNLRAVSDVGSLDLSALYSAPTVNDMRFGFGLNVKQFDISRFMSMMPALDSIMPLLRDISGIINADVAATVDIDRHMDFKLPTLFAAIKLQGDSLQLMDAETFRTIAKWLMFKNKQRNIIDHMTVEMIIADNEMQLFPFIFDIDRYRLGVQGHNDLALNFNYLISVLKSPLPFKFGITLKGNPDDYKIRLGKAKFNEKQAIERKLLVDTARINLVDQLEDVFRRGVSKSKFAKLNLDSNASAADINLEQDPVSAQDSLLFIKEGLIPAPVPADSLDVALTKIKKKK